LHCPIKKYKNTNKYTSSRLSELFYEVLFVVFVIVIGGTYGPKNRSISNPFYKASLSVVVIISLGFIGNVTVMGKEPVKSACNSIAMSSNSTLCIDV
jgi:hypothetical protein